MNRVDGKVALVTGGGAGLGEASCQLLANAGAKVVVSDIDENAAELTVQTIVGAGGEAIAVQQDVANENDWKKVMDITLKEFGKLDVLVNNAGIGAKTRSCRETSLDEWRRVINVNLEGTFLGVRSAIGVMSNNQNTGSIINVSSISAMSGDGKFSYSASKGGVRSLTRTAAIDCRRQGYDIRVNAIYPGEMDTPMSREVEQSDALKAAMKMIPMGRMAQAIEIAKGVLFLASDDSSYMTGSDLVIDGGTTASTGGLAFEYLMNKLG